MNMINEIISKKKINEKNNELASLINSNESKDIVILGVMNGSFYFMKDLMDKLKIDFKYDFLFCSSYFGETKSSGKVDFIYPNKVSRYKIWLDKFEINFLTLLFTLSSNIIKL